MPRPQGPAPAMGGVLGWIFAKQAEFYRQFSGLIRAAKADGSAAWSLIGLSFLYGIFHAAGPGHGKAVISSYLVANEETWKRGVVLSFASALVQALVAVVVVGIAAALLNATAATMRPRRQRDRDCELLAHRSDRRAAPVGERTRLHRRGADAPSPGCHWEPRRRRARPWACMHQTTAHPAIITIIMR